MLNGYTLEQVERLQRDGIITEKQSMCYLSRNPNEVFTHFTITLWSKQVETVWYRRGFTPAVAIVIDGRCEYFHPGLTNLGWTRRAFEQAGEIAP